MPESVEIPPVTGTDRIMAAVGALLAAAFMTVCLDLLTDGRIVRPRWSRGTAEVIPDDLSGLQL